MQTSSNIIAGACRITDSEVATTKTTISDIKHFGLQSSVMAVDKVNAVFTKSFKYIEIFVCSAEYSAVH